MKLWCPICQTVRYDALLKNELFTKRGRVFELHCMEGHFAAKKYWGKKKTIQFIKDLMRREVKQ